VQDCYAVFQPGCARFKIAAHRAGALGVLQALRALSTGRAVRGQRVDEEACVLPAEGGVRFGVCTDSMVTQAMFRCSAPAVSTAPAGTVGR
jgi:hypothetical protein